MDHPLLFQKAIKLLAARDHSVKELRGKLRKYEQDEGLVEAVIGRCLEMKYLDDGRFARLFSESLERKGKGPRFITMELTKRGVEEGIISQVIHREDGNEDVRATEVALKKLKSFSKDVPMVQREKIIRFLQGRGFSSDTCYRVAQSVTKDSH